jgi:hypothetical protein
LNLFAAGRRNVNVYSLSLRLRVKLMGTVCTGSGPKFRSLLATMRFPRGLRGARCVRRSRAGAPSHRRDGEPRNAVRATATVELQVAIKLRGADAQCVDRNLAGFDSIQRVVNRR